MSFVQTVTLFVFGTIGIVAVILFANFAGSKGVGYLGDVELWGTTSAELVAPIIKKVNDDNKKLFNLVYKEKRANTFDAELVSALASGKGPDLFLIPSREIVRESNKIAKIAYEKLSERQFKDTFVDESSLFLTDGGILALPFYSDPLIMYWNKDILSSSGVPAAPKKWSEFLDIAEKITVSSRIGNITQATVAMGGYRNVLNAKEILATLFMQAGDPIVKRDTSEKRSTGPIAIDQTFAEDPGIVPSGVRFYNSFSNPANKNYSWNSELPISKNAFQSGILGIYFGFASDYNQIKLANPHLNFDVGPVPQRDLAQTRITYGELYGLAIAKNTKNFGGAFAVVNTLTGVDASKAWSDALYLPSARRDILQDGTRDGVMSVFYNSAIMARSWLDPDPEETGAIFKELIESILSGVKTEESATKSAGVEMATLITRVTKSL
ncbi:MAG: extracellular solute-binding protein [Candidatus Vogelbacteria bacterium]|nr:extracellular solute-binding protein [Candidatus Vogelbacteria bacterium]